MRKPLVAGNWKMNGDKAMATTLSNALVSAIALDSVDVVVCPPFTLLPIVGEQLKNAPNTDQNIASRGLKLGAQDVDVNDNGAYTGQVSATMLLDCGCSHVIIGHSERRQHYGEDNALVARKTGAALTAGLTAIVCIGETLEERETNKTEAVVTNQLQAVIDENGINAFANIVIAYEPVWAIGTGLTATPEQAQQVHQTIRGQLAEADENIAQRCRILYGGSMKPENAKALIAQTDIDGGLIGGASLSASDFSAICEAAAQA